MTTPSAEVLKNMIDNLESKLDDHKENSKASHEELKRLLKDEVITRLEYTNGKVGELIKWRERLIGMSVIISIVVIPIMGWALWEITHIDDKIENTLSTYEFETTP